MRIAMPTESASTTSCSASKQLRPVLAQLEALGIVSAVVDLGPNDGDRGDPHTCSCPGLFGYVRLGEVTMPPEFPSRQGFSTRSSD